jgi:hypothetical protein
MFDNYPKNEAVKFDGFKAVDQLFLSLSRCQFQNQVSTDRCCALILSFAFATRV